jgi:hypothetical protein
VVNPPFLQGNELTVMLPVSDRRQFYRLERGCLFTATPSA